MEVSAYKTLADPIKFQTVNCLASVPLTPPKAAWHTHTRTHTQTHMHVYTLTWEKNKVLVFKYWSVGFCFQFRHTYEIHLQMHFRERQWPKVKPLILHEFLTISRGRCGAVWPRPLAKPIKYVKFHHDWFLCQVSWVLEYVKGPKKAIYLTSIIIPWITIGPRTVLVLGP